MYNAMKLLTIPVIIGISTGIFVAIIFILKFVRRKLKTKPQEKEATDISGLVKDILRKIHNRALKLKDKALKQYVRLFSSDDFRVLLDNITASMREHQASAVTVRKEVKGRKLSKDMVKRRQQVDDLLSRFLPIIEIDWTLDKTVALGHILGKFPCEQNPKYKGIAELRKQDKQWNKLFGQLNKVKLQFPYIFSDKSLDSMINDHIKKSFGASSIQLFVDLFNRFVPTDLTPTEFISSGTYTPEAEIENRMAKLLRKITRRIEALQLEPAISELPLTIVDIATSNYGIRGKSWGLVIQNTSADIAINCLGELRMIEFADPVGMKLSSWPMNQPLQWESTPVGSKQSIDIPASSKAVLQIANYDITTPTRQNELHLAYHLSEEFREKHYLPKSNYLGGNNYLSFRTHNLVCLHEYFRRESI